MAANPIILHFWVGPRNTQTLLEIYWIGTLTFSMLDKHYWQVLNRKRKISGHPRHRSGLTSTTTYPLRPAVPQTATTKAAPESTARSKGASNTKPPLKLPPHLKLSIRGGPRP